MLYGKVVKHGLYLMICYSCIHGYNFVIIAGVGWKKGTCNSVIIYLFSKYS